MTKWMLIRNIFFKGILSNEFASRFIRSNVFQLFYCKSQAHNNSNEFEILFNFRVTILKMDSILRTIIIILLNYLCLAQQPVNYKFKKNTKFCNKLSENFNSAGNYGIERIIDMELDVYFKIGSDYWPFHKQLDEFGEPKSSRDIFKSESI